MKRLLAVTGFALLFAVPSHAEDVKISRVGVHGAYSMNGDVEDSSPGFGVQAELAINRMFSVELAVTRFSDEYDDKAVSIEQDLTTFGLSGVYRAPLAEQLCGYLLGGLSYNVVDMDASLNAAVYGSGFDVGIDVDNDIGMHLGAGLNFALQNNWELFTEYRYTFLELEGDVSVTSMQSAYREPIKGDYDFGLLKVGANYRF
jgi:opacity protein-like surface antigen